MKAKVFHGKRLVRETPRHECGHEKLLLKGLTYVAMAWVKRVKKKTAKKTIEKESRLVLWRGTGAAKSTLTAALGAL